MVNYNDEEKNELIAEYMRLRKLHTTSEQTSQVSIKNKIQEYSKSNKHDFTSLILGIFGDSDFNTKFLLFFISIYGYIIDKNKSSEQVLDNINNKIDNTISENNTSSVDDKVVASGISNNKKKLTIHQKKNAFLEKLDDKDFLVNSFKHWLDGGYKRFEEKDKETNAFKKFIFHYNQYNWIEEEKVYHVTNPIRDKIKEAVLFLYPYYADKYGEKYFFSLLNGFHLFTYDIYHDGDSENNFFMYKNIHGYTINEVISLYQKADMLPLLLNTFHSIQVKQENNSTKYQIKKIVHVDEASNYIISPHIIYCGIKDIIFYLHIYQCSNEQIHQLYDDFCGVQLVDDILREAEKYASALNENNIDYFSFNKNLLMFQLDSDSNYLTKKSLMFLC